MRRIFVILAILIASEAAAATTTYLPYQGHKIAVHESSGRAIGVLFVHGNSSSARAFDKQMESAFCAEHHCVALDLPGAGQSDNFGLYNTALFREAIVAVARAYRVDNGVMVGWSLGGDLLIQAEAELPQAKAFVFLGTAPLGRAQGLPNPFYQLADIGFVPNPPLADLVSYVTGFFRPGEAAPVQFLEDAERADPNTRAAVAAAASGLDPTFQDELKLIAQIEKPIALLIGDQDQLVNRAYVNAVAPIVPNLYLRQVIVVPNSGHAIQWDAPEAIAALFR
jgi:pimeloyl-ACP methyl ester carboxylesterase